MLAGATQEDMAQFVSIHTRPERRAMRTAAGRCAGWWHVSIHTRPERRAMREHDCPKGTYVIVSIHARPEGRAMQHSCKVIFQPTNRNS